MVRETLEPTDLCTVWQREVIGVLALTVLAFALGPTMILLGMVAHGIRARRTQVCFFRTRILVAAADGAMCTTDKKLGFANRSVNFLEKTWPVMVAYPTPRIPVIAGL